MYFEDLTRYSFVLAGFWLFIGIYLGMHLERKRCEKYIKERFGEK